MSERFVVVVSTEVIAIRKIKPIDRNTLWPMPMFRLGLYDGFSPYVGAGLGLSHLQWSGLQLQMPIVPG